MNILIIKYGALGDIIMSTPSIRALQSYHKNDSIRLLTAPIYAKLFKGWPEINIETFPRKGLAATIQTLCWIRKQGFDRIYDLQSNDRTSIICALSGVPFRAGNHPRYPYHYHPAERYRGQCHAHERLGQILESAGIAQNDPAPFLPVSNPAKEKVLNWLNTSGLAGERFILLHAGASHKHPGKRWPYYLELAQELHRKGLQPVWLGGNEDIEINKSLSSKVGVDITGMFDIAEEVELSRHACFAVTNDSAPMHILSCSGIPVYGIFGPTNWRRTYAIGQKQHVITLDPDESKIDTEFEPIDIKRISLSMVLEKLQADGRF